MDREVFFSRYRFDPVSDRLGAGSFGTVVKAYDTLLDRWVALKISPVTSDSIRLRREVELVSALPPHQNVAVYEECVTVAEAAGETDIAVLRYYPEGSFADLLERGSLAPEDVADILRQILDGLGFLHDNGVVHRDLKPSNILMARRPDGRYVPKIADFGISKPCGGADDTAIAAVSISYASPEQLCGQPQGYNSDLWSYGVIVYRAVTGEMPFTAGSLDPNSMMGRVEIMNKITSGQLPEGLETMPQPWQSVVRSCLVVDPHSRADEKALSILLGAPAEREWKPKPRGPVAPPPVSEPAPVQQPSPKETAVSNGRPWVIVALLVALLVPLLLCLVVLMVQRGRGPVATTVPPTVTNSAPEQQSLSPTPGYEDSACVVAVGDEDYAYIIDDTAAVEVVAVDTAAVDTTDCYDNSFFD